MTIKVLTVFGTRPEVIKMAPVVRALQARPEFEVVVCVTGQHREMLDQMLVFFGITADRDLDVMQPNQSLGGLTARTLERLQPVLDEVRPDWVVVQGDTTTAMTAALAAFYNGVKVAHVEAGLRTHDKHAPYPEEVNRRIIDSVATLHFPPTDGGRQALLAEGEAEAGITVTGNTGIDALFWVRDGLRAGRARPPSELEARIGDRRLVLVTTHRRENFDTGMEEISRALREIAGRFGDVAIVLPVHPNPNVKGPIERMLSGVDRILLVEPVDYGPFVWLLDRAELVLTDSGGIQEEGTALGKTMLVMRDVTERPEAVTAGAARLVGARCERIVEAAAHALAGRVPPPPASARTVFGDGHAAERIADAIAANGRMSGA